MCYIIIQTVQSRYLYSVYNFQSHFTEMYVSVFQYLYALVSGFTEKKMLYCLWVPNEQTQCNCDKKEKKKPDLKKPVTGIDWGSPKQIPGIGFIYPFINCLWDSVSVFEKSKQIKSWHKTRGL